VVTSTREREALDQAIVRGSEALKQGRLDDSQRLFHQALELDPDNTKVLALLGLAYFRANKFAEARPIYEELVERAATDASHRLNLGLVYLKLGQGALAIAALEASRALDPSQGRAISYLGLAYARAGRYVEAYRSFLLAGQNELAAEIEVNLTPAERDGIQAQIGRPQVVDEAQAAPEPAAQTAVPQPPTLPQVQTDRHTAPTPPPLAASRRLDRHTAPTSPPPLRGDPEDLPTPPGQASLDRHTTPTSPGPMVPFPAATASRSPVRAVTQNIVPRGKAPSAPPASQEPVRPFDDRSNRPTPPPPPPAPEITIVDESEEPAGRGANEDVAVISIGPRMTESQQFVLPNRKDGAQAMPRPQPGHSMVSMAVEAAVPASPSPTRTAAGGRPARPLSELATEDLVRPDEGDDRFEIGPHGSLVIRVADRMHVRLEGVHVTGGDLSYELATRRTRGHQTDERFDHGGASLHVVSGRGYLIAAPGRYTFEAVVLDDDILYVREDLVFAFESSLRWENGNVPGLRGKLPVVQFRGDGALALRLERPLVRVKLPPQGMVFVDAERLAGWIGRVIPRAVVPPTGGPMGTMCVECTGEGVVLVEPAAAPAQAAASAHAAEPAPAHRREARRTASHAAPPPPPATPPSEAQPVIPPELANLDDDQI
jgi:hypothetical protein